MSHKNEPNQHKEGQKDCGVDHPEKKHGHSVEDSSCDEANNSSGNQDATNVEEITSQDKLMEYENLLKRQSADFANFRRKSQEEKDKLKDLVLETLMLDLLPIFDNLDRALEASQNPQADSKSIAMGLEGVMGLFNSFLEKHKVEKITSLHKDFDPLLHEALYISEGDYTTKTVVQEVEQAYRLKDKVIRTAKVAVGVPKKNDSHNADSQA